jgi:hypothetical protein
LPILSRPFPRFSNILSTDTCNVNIRFSTPISGFYSFTLIFLPLHDFKARFALFYVLRS